MEASPVLDAVDVDHVLHSVNGFLKRDDYRFLHGFGIRTGIGTEHVDSRRCNVGILLHREHFDGDESHQDNHHGNNAREYRAVYEKS